MCASIATLLTNSTFIDDNPIALDYPLIDSCPAVLSNGTDGQTCTLASNPVFAINATNVQDIIEGVNFARERNVRLVIRNTGHDLLGRSTGGGSLEIWIRYLRTGLEWMDEFVGTDGCAGGYEGGAVKIGGGYVWADVYAEAEERGRIVVGGGDPSVGSIGGWPQGGGHSPASRNYGLGADQILEAEVVLADGSLITANSCQNQDIFFAIRGGGGGTYGIVASTTVKTFPTVPIVAQTLSFAPKSDDQIPQFMEALVVIYSSFPDLNDAGFSGYGSWAVQSFAPPTTISNSTSGYTHAMAVFNESSSYASLTFAPVLSQLYLFNTSLDIAIQYLSFPTYAAYFNELSGVQQTVGSGSAALGSRLLDRPALTSSNSSLAQMIDTIAGLPGQFTSNSLCLVSGGVNFLPDPTSGLNPAWRRSYLHHIVARGWAAGTNNSVIEEIHNDISIMKVGAMRAVAPDTGAYINEGDRLDALWMEDFYGEHWSRFDAIKESRDPEGVFYCPVCVGSNDWVEDSSGRLCRV